MKPLIVPIFIPNEGCRHRCLFCDQHPISGVSGDRVSSSRIRRILDTAMASGGFRSERRPQVAFYGGSFTGLPLSRMRELLEAVAPYIECGPFLSVRVSTRPDALDDGRLELMHRYSVACVELGVQSMDDGVLRITRRGHTGMETVRSVEALKRRGFSVGIQLMPGLPMDSPEVFRTTVERCLEMRPDSVRLYPAVVIRGTAMARLYRAGVYLPWTLETAVEACAEACNRFEGAGIPVIRMGLMDTPSLSQAGRILAGPWHPAFGFLVRSRLRRNALASDLPKPGDACRIQICAQSREIPLIRGYRNEGIRWIEERTKARVLGVSSDDGLPPGKVRIRKL